MVRLVAKKKNYTKFGMKVSSHQTKIVIYRGFAFNTVKHDEYD